MQQAPSFNLVNTLLFPTPESSYGYDDFPEELIWVPKSLDPSDANPEDCVPCLLLSSPSARFFVLYFHSNAEDLGRCYTFCSMLRYQFQVHVLAVEYPGYGICPGGQAHEESVIENAHTAFRFLHQVLKWPLDGIIIFGRSIGCGPALAIASKYKVYGIILVCPFLSVRELCKDFVGPLSRIIDERFPNKDRVKLLSSPLLLVHGKKDSVVPWTHGLQLYQACITRKRLVTPEDMHHNTNLHSDASFFVLPMLQFFGLPDYSFDEMTVPEWVFNKRLSSRFNENATQADAKAKALGYAKIAGEFSPGWGTCHFRIVGDNAGPKMISQQVPPIDLQPKASPRPPPSPRATSKIIKPASLEDTSGDGMGREECSPTGCLPSDSEPSAPSSPSPDSSAGADQQDNADTKQVDAVTAQAFERFLRVKGLQRLGGSFRGNSSSPRGSDVQPASRNPRPGSDAQPSATGSRAASPMGNGYSPKGEKAEQPAGHSPPSAGVSEQALRWAHHAAWEAAHPPELVLPGIGIKAPTGTAPCSRPSSIDTGNASLLADVGLIVESDVEEDDEDLPNAPDDLGFFKVPPTRHGGPALARPASPASPGMRSSPWNFAWWTASPDQPRAEPPSPPQLPPKVSIRI